MNIRNLLKATLVSIVLTSSQSYAQESKQQTITVENKKYQITPNKTILNNQGKRVTNQNELKPIILTYLINKELTNYLPIAQNNLKNFNISKTKAQLVEVKKRYKNILKKPINDLINNSNSIPLFKRIIASLSLYKGAKDEFISIYAVDPKMCIYSDITSHSRKAQKDYENFITNLHSKINQVNDDFKREMKNTMAYNKKELKKQLNYNKFILIGLIIALICGFLIGNKNNSNNKIIYDEVLKVKYMMYHTQRKVDLILDKNGIEYDK